jgi:CheY-like chemotaxis protein
VTARILAVGDDLLVSSRIVEAAKRIGARVETTSSGDETIARMADDDPYVIVVDLGMAGLDLDAIAAAARGRGIPVVAFYPHVDVELRRSARRAGIEHVYARSRFLRETSVILRERLGG